MNPKLSFALNAKAERILLRGSETHRSTSKQISLPFAVKTGLIQTGKGDASPESWEADRVPSDGLVKQSSHILLFVTMGCTKHHHTVWQFDLL